MNSVYTTTPSIFLPNRVVFLDTVPWSHGTFIRSLSHARESMIPSRTANFMTDGKFKAFATLTHMDLGSLFHKSPPSQSYRPCKRRGCNTVRYRCYPS